MLLLHNEIDGQVHSILDVFTVPYRSFHLGFARSLRSAASTSGYKKNLIQKEVGNGTYNYVVRTYANEFHAQRER